MSKPSLPIAPPMANLRRPERGGDELEELDEERGGDELEELDEERAGDELEEERRTR